MELQGEFVDRGAENLSRTDMNVVLIDSTHAAVSDMHTSAIRRPQGCQARMVFVSPGRMACLDGFQPHVPPHLRSRSRGACEPTLVTRVQLLLVHGRVPLHVCSSLRLARAHHRGVWRQ